MMSFRVHLGCCSTVLTLIMVGRKDRKHITSSPEKPAQKLQAPQSAGLSATQACKAVHKGSGAICILVTKSDELDQSCRWLQ